MGRKYGLSLETMNDVLNKASGRSGATERLLPAMLEGSESATFALGLMLKDVGLATQLGLNCGAPMFLHNVVRGLLQAGVYQRGAEANLDEMNAVIEAMADTRFRD